MPLDDARERLLMQYLDGSLAGAELIAFKRQLQRDEQLQAQLRAARHIDTSLRRTFHAGSGITAEGLLARAGEATPNPVSKALESAETTSLPPAPAVVPLRADATSTSVRLFRRLAVAAALLIAAFGAWALWQQFRPEQLPETYTRQPVANIRTAAEYYNAELASGFEPEWVCKDDAEFGSTFRDRLGQALKFNPSTQTGTRMIGLDYTKVLSPQTVSLLAECSGTKVVVLIDRRERDNSEAIHAGCGSLNIFRREIGPLVLYEMTPLHEAYVLDLLEPVE